MIDNNYYITHSRQLLPMNVKKNFKLSSDGSKLSNKDYTIGISNIPRNNSTSDNIYSYKSSLDINKKKLNDKFYNIIIYIVINLRVLKYMIKNGIDIPSRNLFFKSLRRDLFFKKNKFDYTQCIIDLDITNKKNYSNLNYQNNIIDWIYQQENKISNNYTILQENIIKISDIYIDTKLESFKLEDEIIDIHEEKIKPINFKYTGGILNIETKCGKKYCIINHILNNRKSNITNNEKYLNHKISNSTLILTNNPNKWKQTINLINTNVNIIAITNKYHFDKYNYNDLINSDIVLISYNFLVNSNFTKKINVYQQNNQNLSQSIDTMKLEYFRKNKLYNQINPIFMLIYWKRLIIDNFNHINDILDMNYFRTIIDHTKSKYRWVLCDYQNIIKSNYIDMINIITDKYINDNILFSDHLKNKILNIQFEDIDQYLYQPVITNNLITLSNNILDNDLGNSINNFHKSQNNNSIINYKYLRDDNINDFINSNNFTKKFDITQLDKCAICLSKIDNINIGLTKCGHTFCYTCCYNEHKCPICKTKINNNNFVNIISNKTLNNLEFIKNRYGEKVENFIKNINMYSKTIIISQILYTCNILSDLLEFMGYSVVCNNNGYKSYRDNNDNTDIYIHYLNNSNIIDWTKFNSIIIWDIESDNIIYNKCNNLIRCNLLDYNNKKKINLYTYKTSINLNQQIFEYN